MIHSQNQKTVVFQGPLTVSSAATSATTVDTLGFRWASIDVIHVVATATNSSAKWTVLQLQHGPTTDATNFTGIPGGSGTTNATATTNQFVIGVHNDTSVGGVVRLEVNLKDKARHLRVIKQGIDSHSTTSNVCRLSMAQDVPDSAIDRGATAQAIV